MELGRDEWRKLLGTLDRIAVANEKLIELATEERVADALTGPPYCPHCGSLDPSIRNEGGAGQMSEFVLVATCDKCQQQFYAISKAWTIFSTPGDVQHALEEGGNDNTIER